MATSIKPHNSNLTALQYEQHHSPSNPTSSKKNVLYLAYGSNLAASTFRGTRNIKPVSSINAIVPTLKLTFDLPGIPYTEPCFANTHPRDPIHPTEDDPAWQHGLVGVVYEVTPEDYAIIINTEGGGASYADVTVRCWPLDKGLRDVPNFEELQGEGFLAHTLLAPPGRGRGGKKSGDSEPSPRYKGLLTAGAAENDLPASYRAYLDSLAAYRKTQWRQTIGQVTVIAMFGPLLLGLIGLGKAFGDKNGKIPKWLGDMMGTVFKTLWSMYEKVFKPAFGDGERTARNTETCEARRRGTWEKSGMYDEEKGLLEQR